jgi:hypothetical protein
VKSTVDEIAAAIADAPVADTHEHLRKADDLGPMNTIGLLRNSYLTRSLRTPDGSANGLGILLETDLTDDNWETVAEVASRVRFSSYYRWLMKGVGFLYGLPDGDLDASGWEYLSAEIARRYSDETWIGSALDQANIRLIIWDPNWRPGSHDVPDYRAVPSLRINSALVAFNEEENDGEGHNIIREWAPLLDKDVNSLADLESLIVDVLQSNIQAGARSIKSAVAYDRELAFDDVPRSVAGELFGRSSAGMSWDEKKAFGDYIMHFILDRVREAGLVVQFHTGLARLAGSNPLLIEPLILKYHDVVFDVFHGGYPWISEAAALAHNHPNVRLNATWLPQLSTDITARAIKEWLQVVPQASRISWGGDCRTVEESIGALLGLKHALCQGIGQLVDEGYFSLERGVDAALDVLYSGGIAIYGPAPAKST